MDIFMPVLSVLHKDGTYSDNIVLLERPTNSINFEMLADLAKDWFESNIDDMALISHFIKCFDFKNDSMVLDYEHPRIEFTDEKTHDKYTFFIANVLPPESKVEFINTYNTFNNDYVYKPFNPCDSDIAYNDKQEEYAESKYEKAKPSARYSMPSINTLPKVVIDPICQDEYEKLTSAFFKDNHTYEEVMEFANNISDLISYNNVPVYSRISDSGSSNNTYIESQTAE